MENLNLDCWLIVFRQLEPDTRTLYNCLFVSKTFFDLSTRVLYRQPFKVFEGQKRFSPFSATRLDSLLEICSGFTSPSAPIPPIPEQKQKPLLNFFSSFSSSSSSSSTKSSLRATSPWTVWQDSTSICLPTTINYYKLVSEYPSSVTVHSNDSRGHDQLICFAETIPFLFINPDCLDFILPMVSRFRSLHTLHVNLPPPVNQTLDQSPFPRGTFGPDHLAKIVQFVESHRRLFPGLLKSLNNTSKWVDWQELTTVVKAMGGIGKDEINMARFVSRPEDDLGALVVSRLRKLRLECDDGIHEMELKAMEILKRCRVLETLEMKWPKETVLDWSLLDEDKGNSGGIGAQESHSALVFKSSPSQRIGLKHLFIRGATPNVVFPAMVYFKETLESINIQSDHNSIVGSATPLGWTKSFIMPKLKKMEIYRMFFLVNNLSCCPSLETLILLGSETNLSYFDWLDLSISTTISLTLRKLDLNQSPLRGFNLVCLKQLINLEYLRLNNDLRPENLDQECILIDMSTGWYFPYLRRVALFGKFASAIQGQILWVAPKLEAMSLSLGGHRKEGLLYTDSFLCSPLELSFEKSAIISEQNDTDTLKRMTSSNPSTSISMASFPSLKYLKLNSFRLPQNLTSQAFGDAFFGHRKEIDWLPPSTSIENDGQDQSIFRDKKISSLAFPNLEQLELISSQPQGRLYPCVLQAMKSLPKLERVHYSEPTPRRTQYDPLAKWLIAVPGDSTDMSYRNYRYRPKAPVAVESTFQGQYGNGRCVAQFDRPYDVRYQLNPNPLPKGKAKETNTWRQMFSGKH